MKTKLVVCFLAFYICNVQSQYKYSSFNSHQSIKQAINVSSDVIKARTLDFEKKAEQKPLMFHQVKIKIGELNRLSNNVVSYVEKLQKEVDSQRILYELLDEDHYQKVLFTPLGHLTSKGKKLKIKIDSLHNYSAKINIHRLTHLDDFIENNFNTKADFYEDETQINYFDHRFYDKTNYGIMMAMNYLLLDVKTFQLLYFGTVMSY
ncbi:hypothetical protein [Tenacibaculum geojense]|uniref:Gliding motility-associated protein GldM N-terminal domain-containing protein n=1 Tax=Tenacibaculum geojense TaxID=915352 RepID=A0ABW3JVL5_9FLAO